MNATQQLCTFSIGDQLFGVEVKLVQEVLRTQEMTRVTLAARFIRGLINLRGQIVMAVDLRRCLDRGEADVAFQAMNLVIRTVDGPVSFLVDRIHDVIEVDESTFEPPPLNLLGPTRAVVRGSFTIGGRLVLLIDTDAVLALLEEPGDRVDRAS